MHKIEKNIVLLLLGNCLTGYAQHIGENSLNKPKKGILDYFKKELISLEDDSSDFEPNLSSLALSVDLLARPEDFTAGNFLAPKGTGNYSEFLWAEKDRKGNSFKGMYEINLEVQSPSTTNDTAGTLNRILSSGGVGNISGLFKSGLFGNEDQKGITLSIIPAFIGKTQNN